MTKRILNLLTALVVAVSLAGVLPAMTASADIGDPVEGYVCTYYENSYGYWCKYTYDSKGNETYYEDNNGNWDKYEYDSNGNETYVEYSTGYWKKYEYDSNGHMIYGEDSDGDWSKYEYDSNGNQTYYENSYGYSLTHTWTYTYYSNGKIKTAYSLDSNGYWCKYTYDSKGNETYYEDSNGYWFKYTYDTNGNRIYENSIDHWTKAVYAKIGSKESMELYNPVTNNPTSKPNTNTTTKSNFQTKVTKPAKVKSVKLTAKKKKLNISWKKVSGATGYEIQYAMNNKFTKNKKSVTVKKNKITIKNLKPKKKYFVKVRAYKKENGSTYYGKWSKVVKKKVK